MANSGLDHIQKWIGPEQQYSTILKFATYIQQQCEGALVILSEVNLTTEAKEGLIQTVNNIAMAFRVDQLSGAIANHLPRIESAISQFAIIVSLTGRDVKASEIDELRQLIAEVEAVRTQFDQAELDPLVAQTANKHLHVLATFLRNVDALGLDAAIAAYAELIIKLKRVDATATEQSKAKTSELWTAIKSWQDRFASIDQAVNTGSSLLQHGEGLIKLIGSAVG